MRRLLSPPVVFSGTVLALCLALLAGVDPGARPAWAASAETFSALVHRLDAQDWVPPYFAGHVPVFNAPREEQLLRRMSKESFTLVPVGLYAYRTSPLRVEVGKRLFHRYDWGTSQRWRSDERYMFYALGVSTFRDFQSRYGVLGGTDAQLVGIVGMPAPDGRIDYGWSCALCHEGAGDGGRPTPGVPNHLYEYGRVRYQGLVAHDPAPDFARPGATDHDIPIGHLAALGPGRMDMNADRVENPVKIPPLWGLKEVRTGIFANGSIGNIWFVLGIHNGGISYPSSELLEALVAYVLSIEPPPNPRPKGAAEQRGEKVFERAGCRTCHAGPYYTNGEVISLEVIGTDPERARQEFPKGYRVPTLRRLDLQRLFLHDGSIGSLGDLFSRERLKTTGGHLYGLDLSEAEKRDLVAFLLSL
ncbi:MAG: hypothetical protein ACE5HU_00120 [Acidobacteriota bacterium]